MSDPCDPNLVVIGAMKCGTTSLHEYLSCHPEIGMSDRKEIDFFAGNNVNQPLGWYRRHFDPDMPVRGESSQNYTKAHLSLYAGAPDRMVRVIPKAKLIYLVRDPIERYRSHIVENYIGETEDMKQLSIETDNHIRTGLYYWQLTFFLRHYPQEQILVVDADDLRTNRLATMNRIFAFLDVARIVDPATFSFEVNINGEDVVPPRIRASLPYRVLRRLAPETVRRTVTAPAVRKVLFPGSYKAPLSDVERARLAERFAPDVAALRALTGQSFAGWQV